MGTGRFFNRYKASLDTFWLKDENLEEFASFAISLRRSSKTSKLPSNSSTKSPAIYVLIV
jgi:hypothetical protein